LRIAVNTAAVSVYLNNFIKPYGIIIDKSGNMYVSEVGRGDIMKIVPGTFVRTVFALGFNGPRHLNKDLLDNIYVADFGNNAIKMISPAGKVTVILGTGLSMPRQAAFDSSGNLFIADYGSNALLKSIPTGYSINAPLPSGLNFNTSTGQITGTVNDTTTVATTYNYTITAYNYNGTSNTTLTITVVPRIIAAFATYSNDTTTSQADTTMVDTQKSVLSANLNSPKKGADKILVHQAVSPNGDGINDFLLIEGIEDYSNNTVSIFNRNGETIYNVNGYNNSSKLFDGHSNVNGRLQQLGTYFYVVEYNINGAVVRKTGYFVLKFS
jgi:gliding motility-associated-like protein